MSDNTHIFDGVDLTASGILHPGLKAGRRDRPPPPPPPETGDDLGPVSVTWCLLATLALAFVYQVGTSADPVEMVRSWGFVAGCGDWTGFLRSIFAHGNAAHLLGNVFLLFLVGRRVEEDLGSLPFLLLFLTSGVAALVAQLLFHGLPVLDVVASREDQIARGVLPILGASGAIYGCLGAVLFLRPLSPLRDFSGLCDLMLLISLLALPKGSVLMLLLAYAVIRPVWMAHFAPGILLTMVAALLLAPSLLLAMAALLVLGLVALVWIGPVWFFVFVQASLDAFRIERLHGVAHAAHLGGGLWGILGAMLLSYSRLDD